VRDGSSDPLDLGLLVADPETPLSGLRWTFTGGRNTTAAVDPRYRLRITSARDWQGRESVTLAVADPEGASASVTFTVAGSVTPLPGDFDGNGRVDLEDFFSFAAVYGSQTGGPRYEVRFDMDRNGRIDLDDFFLFADGFGKVRGS
jgi:hypothetical protein